LDINRSSGLAGASLSQPIELLNRNGGEPKFSLEIAQFEESMISMSARF
jgi:hypothetical protein